MESMDSILSGAGKDTPAPERIVDEPEAIVGTDLAAPVTELPEERPEQPPKTDAPPKEQKTVPIEALHEERTKVKRYTEEVAEFRRAQAQQAAQIAQMTALLEKSQQSQQTPPDWYADPEAVLTERLGGALDPIQQSIGEIRGSLVEDRIHRALKDDEKVAQLEQAVGQAMAEGDQELAAIGHALKTQGPRAVPSLIKWFEKKTFDPAAERERLKAELLAEMQSGGQPSAGQQQRAPTPPPVMPSNFADVRNAGNRGGPTWSGPPSIEDALAQGRKSIFK